jgi:CHASE2 domain-containing sensor protein
MADVIVVLFRWCCFIAFLGLVTGDGTLSDWVQQRANADSQPVLSPSITAVLIDDAAISAYPGFATRSGIACLVRLLSTQRPAVIALDYVFEGEGEHDPRLPEACGPDSGRIPATDAPLVAVSSLDWSSGVLEQRFPSSGFLPDNVLRGFGEVELSRIDEVVREASLHERSSSAPGDAFFSFPLVAWAAGQAYAAEGPAFDIGQVMPALNDCIDGRAVPGWLACDRLRADGPRSIRFLPPDHAVERIRVSDLFSPGCIGPGRSSCLAASMFRNRVVFIGDANSRSDDRFRTPLFSDFPRAEHFFRAQADIPELSGVVLQSLIAYNIHADAFVRTPTPVGWLLLALIGLLAIIAVFLPLLIAVKWSALRRRPILWRTIALFLGLVVVYPLTMFGLLEVSVWQLVAHGVDARPLVLLSVTTLLVLGVASLLPEWVIVDDAPRDSAQVRPPPSSGEP